MDYVIISVWFVLQVMIHELGHYVTYRYYNHKPKLKLTWWGLQIGEPKDVWKFTAKQYYFIGANGIFIGGFFTLLVVDSYWFLVYLLMCFVDFQILIIAWSQKLQNKKSLGLFQFELIEKEKIKWS